MTTTSYIQLQVPLQVIELKPRCEAFTNDMLIAPMNNLKINNGNDTQKNKLDKMTKQLTNLKYSIIRDFTAMQGLSVTNRTDEELSAIAEKFPEITDITLPMLNETLNAINEDYPYEFPLWGIIAITVLTTVVAIIIVAICMVCRHKGNCLIEQYFTKDLKRCNSFESISISWPPSRFDINMKVGFKKSTHHSEEPEVKLQEMITKAPPSTKRSMSLTHKHVKNILKRDYNVDFKKYDKKLQEISQI